MIFRACQFEFTFPRPALVMGIVNVTPDSFSDGGLFLDASRAVEHARQLVAEGADILDIGGESTRPNAQPVGEAEELRRVMPVIEALAGTIAVPISIDTCKPAVARAALAAGASLVNDVATARQADEMFHLVAETGAGYVAMHSQGTPQTMQLNPVYADVVAEVDVFFGDCLHWLGEAGVAPEQVVLDVGLGFGKTVEHNLELLAALDRFQNWNRPLLLGASRKSFLGTIAGITDAAERLAGSLACASWSRMKGAQIIRAHDVKETLQALRVTQAILARAT
jgi:dihydropteroate synthase